MEEDKEEWIHDTIEINIDGTLDLHTFHPREIKTLLPDYFEACQRRGICNVRIIHGKGTGTLCKSVHSILDRLSIVESYRLGGVGEGGWGATLVTIK